MKNVPGSRSTSAVDGHNSSYVSVSAAPAMTWKDRQRTRVPSFDLDDNPFCLERRTNEEKHKMQLNKNPSLLKLTSADVRRTASFMVDDEKPFREFSRKKQQLLAWSLRDASAHKGQKKHKGQTTQTTQPLADKAVWRSKTVPSRLRDIDDAEEFFAKPESGRRRCNRVDVDVDTMPKLEPYRREVAALQPITFGHRPVSASRMFNPSTMMTSFGNSSSSSSCRGDGVGNGTRTSMQNKQRRFPLKRARKETQRVPGRVPGLSAPMLKELLQGKKPRPRGGEAKGGFPTPAAAYVDGDTRVCPAGPRGGGEGGEQGKWGKQYTPKVAGAAVLNRDDNLSGASASASNESEWRSIDATDSGRVDMKAPDAAWLKRSGLGGIGFPGRGGDVGESAEGAELKRIFSDTRPQWDGTPAPLPAPKDVRRAISSLLQPDPDERFRDKIAKSRKAAAGIAVTSWSIMEEREKMLLPEKTSSRWEMPPATPREMMACEEVKRLAEWRRERDGAMARRIREAELSAFYDKIPPSEKLYRNTLAIATGRA